MAWWCGSVVAKRRMVVGVCVSVCVCEWGKRVSSDCVCARECEGWDQALAWGRNGGESSTINVYLISETKGCLARTGRERDTYTQTL